MAWRCLATVNYVVDGDTFDADFDLGWGMWKRSARGNRNRVRPLGIDAPERFSPEGPASKELLSALLPPGTQVWVESHELDSFGRTLASVTLVETGANLIDLLPPEWRV
jgi:endonuclease YncB( thermonuclease family)